MNAISALSPAPTGYRELIRGNANFRFLWFGQIVSLLGDWFNLIASAALIAMLSQSGLAVGGLFVVRMLAPFLVSPIAGVVADRYNRKRVLIAADLIRAVAVFGFLLVRDVGQLWLLYTLTAIQLGVSGFFFPTRNAILPDLVSPRGIGAANALSSATWSVMLALGAAIGGLVSGVWGMYPAFIIDGLTFLLSAIFITQISLDAASRADALTDRREKTVAAALGEYLDGLRYLGKHVDVFFIALHKAALALFLFSGFQVVQVAISEDKFAIGIGGSIGLGLMFALNGVGTGIGPIVARFFTGDRDRLLRLSILLGYVMGALGLVITAPLFNFETVLFGIMLRGVGGGIVWVFSTQLLLQLVPDRVRGRVFATEFALFTLMSALAASLVGGLLDSRLGISGLIWWMAGLTLVPTLLWMVYLVKRMPQKAAPVLDNSIEL